MASGLTHAEYRVTVTRPGIVGVCVLNVETSERVAHVFYRDAVAAYGRWDSSATVHLEARTVSAWVETETIEGTAEVVT